MNEEQISYLERVYKSAKSAHEYALTHLVSRDLEVHTIKYGKGYFYEGSVSEAIRKGVYKKTGKEPSTTVLDHTRFFLKNTGNMVATDRIDNYTYKIFVSSEWNDPEHGAGEVFRENRPAARKKRAAKTKNPVNPDLVCSECGFQAATNQGLGVHRKRAHGITGSKTTRRVEESGWRPINQWSEEHQKYVCPECDFASETWNGLARHKGVHNKERAKKQEQAVPAASGVSGVSEASWRSTNELPTEDLLAIVLKRFNDAQSKTERESDETIRLKQQMELIQSLIGEVSEGKISPLKALSEIDEATRL